jgi:hypothetical protein
MEGYNMTKEELQNKNFLCFQLSSKLSSAAILAGLLGVPLEAFKQAAEDAYLDCLKYLNWDPEKELNDPGDPDITKPDDPAHCGPAEVIRPKTESSPASDVNQPE